MMLSGNGTRSRAGSLAVVAAVLSTGPAHTDTYTTTEDALVSGLAAWKTRPLFTVGETIDGYTPVGLLDGVGALQLDEQTVRLFVNHELSAGSGHAYFLANGTELRGGRVSFFDVDRATRELCGAGLAYDTIVDRAGNVVTSGVQINEGSGAVTNGLDRSCSSALFEAGSFGLADHVYFTGEETGGGQEFALDVANGVLHCVPQLGRAAYENVTLVEPPEAGQVAILVGDDRAGAPLWLYVGTRDAIGDGSFLDRNGLGRGTLSVWVADGGDLSPQEWSGTGSSRTGTFVPVTQYDPNVASQPGWDGLGYASQSNLDAQADAAGAFQFSRPEDVSTNPGDGTQAVLASTGRASSYPADAWGTIYRIDIEWGTPVTAEVTVLYDGDDAGSGQLSHPDWGLRSPDNLHWADDGKIYVQEDRATSPSSLFGSVSGQEASIFQLDPRTGVLRRIAQVNRTATLPAGQTDGDPNDLGDWETSGVLDVTNLFVTDPGECVLVVNVQAHSVTNGGIATQDLEQGGQLVLLGAGSRRFWDAVAEDEPAPNPAVEVAPDSGEGGSASLRSSPRPGPVRASIFDVTGRLVQIVGSPFFEVGESVRWDGRDLSGRPVPSGVYFARIPTPTGHAGAKVLIVR